MNEIETKQAYLAMFTFLDDFWNRTKSDDVGALLGSMPLLADGKTADPSIWEDWVAAIDKAVGGDVDAHLRFESKK